MIGDGYRHDRSLSHEELLFVLQVILAVIPKRYSLSFLASTIVLSVIYKVRGQKTQGKNDMSEKLISKIDIKLGNLAFAGEGDQDWLALQLQKVIDAAESLSKVAGLQRAPAQTSSPEVAIGGAGEVSLATYLRAKGADKNQTMRFLATAHWLSGRGEQNLTSTLVAKALADNHQSRLANPADCLNKNVAKGLCEKKKDGGFFISPEGLRELGQEQ